METDRGRTAGAAICAFRHSSCDGHTQERKERPMQELMVQPAGHSDALLADPLDGFPVVSHTETDTHGNTDPVSTDDRIVPDPTPPARSITRMHRLLLERQSDY